MTTSPPTINVSPVHPHIGALVTGVDLSAPMNDDLFDEIYRAFLQYSVLVFRNQKLSQQDQVRFSRRFGRLSFSVGEQNPHCYELANTGDDGEILPVNSLKRTLLEINTRWHTDSSFKPVPDKASALCVHIVPETERADTEFASMRGGWQRLDRARQNELRTLTAIHDYSHSLRQLNATAQPAESLDHLPPCEHPVVRKHPDTGDVNLYVSSHMSAIVGLSDDASAVLIKELIDWCTQPEFVYSHEWQVNDLVIWDNRCVLHRASLIPHQELRRAYRTTVIGEGPIVSADHE